MAELKPDQSPVVVKKGESVPATPKVQDDDASVAVPAPITSTGSGRRRNKKQKTEAAITGSLLLRTSFSDRAGEIGRGGFVVLGAVGL